MDYNDYWIAELNDCEAIDRIQEDLDRLIELLTAKIQEN